MLLLSLGHIQGHLVPWLQKLSANPRRRAWWIVFIYLTVTQCWHLWVPWGSPMECKHKMHHTCKVCQTNISNQRHVKDVDLNGGSDICQTDILGTHPKGGPDIRWTDIMGTHPFRGSVICQTNTSRTHPPYWHPLWSEPLLRLHQTVKHYTSKIK